MTRGIAKMTSSTIKKQTKETRQKRLQMLGGGLKNVKTFFYPLEKEKKQRHLSQYYNISALRRGRTNLTRVLDELRLTEESFLKSFWFLSADNTNVEGYDEQHNPCQIILDEFKNDHEMAPLMQILTEYFAISDTIANNVEFLKEASQYKPDSPEYLALFSRLLNNLPQTLAQCEVGMNLFHQFSELMRTPEGREQKVKVNKKLRELGIDLDIDSFLITCAQRAPRYKLLLEEIMKIQNKNIQNPGFDNIFEKFQSLFAETADALGVVKETITNINNALPGKTQDKEKGKEKEKSYDLPVNEGMVQELKEQVGDTRARSGKHEVIREFQRSSDVLEVARKQHEFSTSRSIAVVKSKQYDGMLDEMRKKKFKAK